MPQKSTRSEIIDVADRLFYRQGFDHTSFADIASKVKISRGNFYHHFKTKDAILDAVIDARLEAAREMIRAWEAKTSDPAERIRCYIHILFTNRTEIRRYGCPVGTLCNELAKLRHDARSDANGLFELFRVWLKSEFERLGRRSDADDLALQVLAWSQGAATIYNAYGDDAFLDGDVARMDKWLDDIAQQNGDG